MEIACGENAHDQAGLYSAQASGIHPNAVGVEQDRPASRPSTARSIVRTTAGGSGTSRTLVPDEMGGNCEAQPATIGRRQPRPPLELEPESRHVVDDAPTTDSKVRHRAAEECGFVYVGAAGRAGRWTCRGRCWLRSGLSAPLCRSSLWLAALGSADPIGPGR